MRVAIWHNLPSGGGKRALYEQVAGLLARGHTLEAWCPAYADQTYLPLSQLVREHVLPSPPVSLPPNRRFRRYRQTPHLLAVMEAHARACAAAIAPGAFDVVLAHPCQHLRVPMIGRYLQRPKVLYLQEPDRPLYEASPSLPWPAPDLPKQLWRSPRQLKRWAQDALLVQTLRIKARAELTSVQAFDRVLVNSLYSRETLLRAYGIEATVCYLGVDAQRFRTTGAPRQPFVVSLGALHPTKRVDHAIRAISTIATDVRPELVWIANFADHAYQQAMLALAQTRGVRLTVLVNIPDEAVVDWLNRAAVMLYTPRLEPFGFAPLEANACETPVVATAEGGVRETIIPGVNGVLVTSNDPTALGAAVLQVLQNPAWGRALGVAGRRQVLERWTWSRSIDQLEQALLTAVEASPHADRRLS